MKNLNKAFAILVVIAMMVTSVAFASDFTDVADDAVYAEAVGVGAALGLFNGYEDGSFQPEGDITRAEFAAIVVRMLGQEAQASGSQAATSFTDVPADHWAAGYINIVSKLGIVNGYGDGTFGPEDNVQYEQAIKMIIVALGYEPTLGTGGYPVAYTAKASDIGLTTDVVGGVVGSAANRGVVAQLVLKAIDTPLTKQTGYGTNTDYTVYDGYNNTTRQTLMSENMNVVKLQATVTYSSKDDKTSKNQDPYVKTRLLKTYDSKLTKSDFSVTNSAGATVLDPDFRIDAGETNLCDMLGTKVIVYASFNPNVDSDPTALYVKKDTSKTYEMTLTDSQLESMSTLQNGGSGSSAYTYYNMEYREEKSDRNTQSFTLDATASVYVNDGTTDRSLTQLLNPNNAYFYGTATFAKLGATSCDYDTVYITNYETVVVDTVNTNRGKVTSKNNAAAIVYDPTDTSVEATLYGTDGKVMSFDDLKEWDVVSVNRTLRTSNKTVVTATLLDTAITGTVTGVADENTNDVEYTIGSETYGIDPAAISNSDIVLGDVGTFYLDQIGNIVYYNTESSANTNYAYIVAVGKKGGNLDTTTQLKLFTYDGQYGTVDTASKVKIDGITGFKTEDLTNAAGTPVAVALSSAKTTAETASIIAKNGAGHYTFDVNNNINGITALAVGDVITYTANSDGEITAINRCSAQAGAYSAYKKYFAEYTTTPVTLTYDENAEAFTGASKKLYVTDKTVIMVANSSFSDEDDYSIFNTSVLSDDQDLRNCRAFNVDDDNNVGFILVGNTVVIDSNVKMALVKSIATSNNEKGDKVNVVKGCYDGAFSDSALTTKDESDYGVAAYSTFVPKFNTLGAVSDAYVIATTTGSAVSFSAVNMISEINANSKIKYYYGAVSDISNGRNITFANGYKVDSTTVSGNGTANTDLSINKSATNIYVYDSGASSSNRVTVDDLDVVSFEDDDNNANTPKVAFVGNTQYTSVYAVAREYDGDIIDVVLYLIK